MTTDLSPSGDTDRLAAALAEVNRLDPLDLLALHYLVQNALPSAEFPRLIATTQPHEFDEDDDGSPVRTAALTCPHCEQTFTDPDELIAVDIDERWTGASEIDATTREVQFHYDGDTDYQGFIYKHACNQPVRLPEDWTEAP